MLFLERRVVLMNRTWEKFKKSVMYFSAKERKERLLSCDRNKYLRLQEMSDLNLKLEYIDIKSKYEYEKNMLILFLVSIVIAVLTNVWKYFDSFLRQVVQFSSSYQENTLEAVKVGFIIALIVAVGIIFLIIVLLIMYIKQVYCLYKELLMIEEIRRERQENGRNH